MPDVLYRIDYEAPAGKVNGQIDSIIAKLTKLDALIDSTKAKLKTLGTDTPGLKKLLAELRAVDVELKSKVTDAGAAEKALKDVGKGNHSIGDMTKRLADLEKQLQDVTAAATAAAGAAGQVGSGGPSAGGGGGGGGGVAAGGIKGVGKSLLRAGAIGAGLGLARKAMGAVGEADAAKRDAFAEASDKVADFREGIRELAALQGRKTPDDALIREQAGFQKETGLLADEAVDFRLEYGGATAPGKAKGLITEGTAAGLEKQAAKFAVRYDLDTKSAGRMAGLLSNYGKVDSVAQGAGMMAESAELLNLGGLGSIKSMMAPMIGLEADMLSSEEGGRFKDLATLSARFGATTYQAKSASGAGTQIRQANRLLRKFNGQDEEAFLRKAGITPDDDYETSLRKIAPLITGADGDQVLMHAGFANSTERDSVIKQARNNEVVDKLLSNPRIAEARANAVRDNDAYQSSEIGVSRASQNAEFGAEMETGIRGKTLREGRSRARSAMKDPNQPGGQRLKAGGWGAINDYLYGYAAHMDFAKGEEYRVDAEAINRLIEGGKQVQVDIGEKFPHLKSMSLSPNYALPPDKFQDEYEAASAMVQGAGGDPFGGAPKDAARKMRAAADALDKLGAGAAPAPGSQPGRGPAEFNQGRR